MSYSVIPIKVLTVLLLVSAAVSAADYGDISVRIESLSSGVDGNGYEEYRATISNRSATQTHNVILVMPATGGRSYGATISEMRRAVDVAPSTSATVSIFLPPLDIAGYDFAVIIDGQRQQDETQLDIARTGAWVRRISNSVHIIVSKGVDGSGLMNEPKLEEGFKNAAGNVDVAHLPYEFPLNEWSSNWIGYTKFDAVVVSSADLQAMPDGVRAALLRYVETGGAMLVIGSWDAPAQWRSRLSGITAFPYAESAQSTPATPETVQTLPAKQLDLFYLGFGVVVATGATDVRKIDFSQWAQLRDMWRQTRNNQSYHPSLTSLNRYFQIVDRVGVPVRGLFLLIIVFVIMIGPINLLWLARRKKKIWFLWTVPAISLLTCLAIAAFAFFGEGLSATSRTEAMTILDERERRATTIGWTAFYSPVTPNDGLHFSYETELMPQFPTYWEYRRRGSDGRSIDWTNDQHLSSGWITARVPAYFKLKKSESRRERLTTRQENDGSVSIVNGLGADIKKLWWADKGGKIHHAVDIPAGAQSPLSLMQMQAAGAPGSMQSIYRSGERVQEDDWIGQFEVVEANPEKYLMPNCYLAVIEASPFVEDALRGVKTRKQKSLVYGIQEEK